jgi:hypothetical protein
MTGSAMTLYEKAYTDQASGSAVTGPSLGLDAVDSLTYTNTTSWATTYSSTKYLQFTFPAVIPTGASVTSVVYNRSWKSNGAPSVCYYFEVYSGSTFLAAHGSTGSNISCATTSYVNDQTTLAEVNTVAYANSVVIRVYEKATAAAKSIDDLGTLTITYSLT